MELHNGKSEEETRQEVIEPIDGEGHGRPTPIKHAKQKEVLEDNTRFKYLLAGRRGGKTVLLREMLLRAAHYAPWDSDVYYIGPTNQTARELMWEQIRDRLDEMKWQYREHLSGQRFILNRDRKIYIIGGEKMRRIRGHKVYFAALDEVAYFTGSLFECWRAVRPTLTDLEGSAVVATTPNGKGTEAYRFYQETHGRDNWKRFKWDSSANPFLSKDEIEEARRDLDERSFRQEYLAEWESFDGLAYYTFDEETHLKPCAEFIPGEPWRVMFDFNVNPTTMLIGQRINGHTFVRKEYSLNHNSTVQTVTKFCEDHKEIRNQIFLMIYGDAAGFQRKSTTGISDYQYVEEILSQHGFQFKMNVPGVNPPIIERVARLNAALKNSVGQSRITIDPSCKELYRDLSGQTLDGRFPSPANNLGHKADALGYFEHWTYVTEKRKPTRTVEL